MTKDTKQDGTAVDDGLDVFGRRFKFRDDLRQRDVAAWNRVYVSGELRALADERQAALQAAIVAGWIESPPCRHEEVTDGATGQKSKRFYFDDVEVNDMTAAEVNYYGMLCSRHFDALLAIPKVSSSQ